MPSPADLALHTLPEAERVGTGDAGAVGTGYAGRLWAVVADGVGSRACDGEAARRAVARASAVLDTSVDPPETALHAAVDAAHGAVAAGQGACRGMRATFVAVLWAPGAPEAHGVALGDSALFLRDGHGLRRLTSPDVAAERVPASLRHLEVTAGHPLFREGLTRSLGMPGLPPPTVHTTPFPPGATLALVTDGVLPLDARDARLCDACDTDTPAAALAAWLVPGIGHTDDATVALLRRRPAPGDTLPRPPPPAFSLLRALDILDAALDAADVARALVTLDTLDAGEGHVSRAALVARLDRAAHHGPSADPVVRRLLALARVARW